MTVIVAGVIAIFFAISIPHAAAKYLGPNSSGSSLPCSICFGKPRSRC